MTDKLSLMEKPSATQPFVERRHFDRSQFPPPPWIVQSVGNTDEVTRLKNQLPGSAQQMADLRSRIELLMAANSDLRWRLGEMTLQWVDACSRIHR